MQWKKSAAGRRRERLEYLKLLGLLAGAAGAVTIAVQSPLAADAILAYFMALVVITLAFKFGLPVALLATPAALAAYRGALDLSWRTSPTPVFYASFIAILFGPSLAACIATKLAKEDREIRWSRATPGCVAYDTFSILLSKDIARSQRYHSIGALALFRPRNIDALRRPDAYQQRDLLISHIGSAIAGNLRRSDTACYLGDLYFVVAFPHSKSEQAHVALERLRSAIAPLGQRLCRGLGAGPLELDIVCLEYPSDGTVVDELLDIAAYTLGGPACRGVIGSPEQSLSPLQRRSDRASYA